MLHEVSQEIIGCILGDLRAGQILARDHLNEVDLDISKDTKACQDTQKHSSLIVEKSLRGARVVAI